MPPASQASLFRNAIVTKHSSSNASKLGYPRAYSISLSPQLIYTRSNLLPALVSSKIYRQLEFLAVGSWWIYEGDTEHQAIHNSRSLPHELKQSRLSKIPGSRENVFQDKSLDLRSTRSLMKFLKLAADEEAHASILDEWGQESFPTFLTSQFKMPPQLQTALLALASSLDPPSKTLTLDALPRIHRHLTSIGLFGPGFGAVIPKWGGLAEVSQVACRAGAVGGGVYVLKKGVESIQHSDPCHEAQGEPLILNLQGGEQIKTHWIIGTNFDLPQEIPKASNYQIGSISRSATIISSNLSSLFPIPSEGAQAPAGAIIVLAGGSLPVPSSLPITEVPPIYLIVHSSDTGECPKGQCQFLVTFFSF